MGCVSVSFHENELEFQLINSISRIRSLYGFSGLSYDDRNNDVDGVCLFVIARVGDLLCCHRAHRHPSFSLAVFCSQNRRISQVKHKFYANWVTFANLFVVLVSSRLLFIIKWLRIVCPIRKYYGLRWVLIKNSWRQTLTSSSEFHENWTLFVSAITLMGLFASWLSNSVIADLTIRRRWR